MNKKMQEMKSKLRLDINRSLLAICFTIFALVITLNPRLFRESALVPLQLILSIPLLLSSTFARSKLAYSKKPVMWDEYAYVTFLIAYAFMINVIGILLSSVISTKLGIIFLGFNILVSFVYSGFELFEDRSKLASRMRKDLFFAVLIIIGGILPSLGYY